MQNNRRLRNALFMVVVLVSLIVAMHFSGCSKDKQQAESAKQKAETVEVATAKMVKLNVNGMTCQGCVNTIETALADKDGVVSNSVDLSGNSAEVVYDPLKINEEQIVSVIAAAGYTASVSE